MKTYIVLLRGINVGGHNKIKMADLKELLENLGFTEVATYIQSGNVVLRTPLENQREIGQIIEQGIENQWGFRIGVLVKSKADWKHILNENPFTDAQFLENNNLYFVLLMEYPSPEDINGLNQEDYPNERFIIVENCVYLACLKGYGKAKLNNNVLERKLGVRATARNHRTMMKLLEMVSMENNQ